MNPTTSLIRIILIVAAVASHLTAQTSSIGNEIVVKVGEGAFVFQNVAIRNDSSGTATFNGTLINNSGQGWSIIQFKLRCFDAAGQEYFASGGIDGTVDFIRVKRDERRKIEGDVISSPLLFFPKAPITRVEMLFVKGAYSMKYTWKLRKPLVNDELRFEDQAISIQFTPETKQLDFNLWNKTDNPIKIDWNQVSYVDSSGKAHKVMHAGVRFIDRDKPQAPTLVPPSARIDEIIFPLDYVYYESGRFGGWRQEPMFPNSPDARRFKNQSVSVFMPMEINGVTKNYSFVLEVINVEPVP